jgi:hypothetical protein
LRPRRRLRRHSKILDEGELDHLGGTSRALGVDKTVSFWRPTVNFTGQVGYSTGSFQTALIEVLFERLVKQRSPDFCRLADREGAAA